MFKVGQTVYHRDGKRSGTVLECDGDIVFIEQANGAELDFPVGQLSATPPADAKPSSAAPEGYAMVDRKLTAADVTPEHIRVLGLVPVRTVQAVAALFERKPGAGRFGALDAAAKLNFIAEVTCVPYRTMREYADRPGEMGLLMGKGLADSQRRAG
jgi:hypothetical protein